MIKVFAFLKFFASVILLMSILVGLFFSLEKSTEVLIIVISSLLLLSFAGLYSYYLIKTGIWNLKDKNFSKYFTYYRTFYSFYIYNFTSNLLAIFISIKRSIKTASFYYTSIFYYWNCNWNLRYETIL